VSKAARALIAAALVLLAAPAQAHPPPLGIPGYFGGFLHPMFVPAHLMAVLALGLLIGQQRPQWGKAALAAYVLALLAGLTAIAFAFVPERAGEAVLACAAVCGALTAAAPRLHGAIGGALAALTGLALALDSPPEVVSLREANLMLLGTAVGGTLLLLAIAGVAARLTRDWQRIGIRIAGSWIAASAVLVLALRFAR
jgi:urease accessory protein